MGRAQREVALPEVSAQGGAVSDDRCEHVRELEALMRQMRLDVYSEHGEEPDGWVNVHCRRCHRTYEIRLDTRVDARPLPESSNGGEG